MQEKDNRFACSDEKKSKIKMSKQATAIRRQHQVCKVFECKIVEKRLNNKQREELKMLFVEGKWFYNHLLTLHKDSSLRGINVCRIKEVDHFDKDGNFLHSKLEYISAAEKQALQARMISNEMAIKSLVKSGR